MERTAHKIEYFYLLWKEFENSDYYKNRSDEDEPYLGNIFVEIFLKDKLN